MKVLLTGNMGPCEGCKTRIHQFLQDVRQILGAEHRGIWVSLEANYTTRTNDVIRKDTDTRYGYPDDTQEINSDGYRYFAKTEIPWPQRIN